MINRRYRESRIHRPPLLHVGRSKMALWAKYGDIGTQNRNCSGNLSLSQSEILLPLPVAPWNRVPAK
jgi:hypothetical protein